MAKVIITGQFRYNSCDSYREINSPFSENLVQSNAYVKKSEEENPIYLGKSPIDKRRISDAAQSNKLNATESLVNNTNKTNQSNIEKPLATENTQESQKAKILVADVGNRKIEIIENNDDSITVTINPPEITHVTSSGGGTKGVVYPMCVKTLQTLGLWNSIKSLSGTSIGSQITFFAGIGMDHKQIGERLKAIKPYSIFYREEENTGKIHWKSKHSNYEKPIKIEKDSPVEDAKNKSFIAIVFAIITSFIWDRIIQPIIKILETLYPKNGIIGDKLEAYLNLVAAEVLLRKIETLNDEDKLALKDIIHTLQTQKSNSNKFNESITFQQLDTLSNFFPEIKHIEITGTALFEGKPQLVIFNKLNHPDMPISTAVRISSSFPRVFPTHKVKNFLSTGEDVEFTDGGCMLNTPSKKIIHKHKKVNLMDANDELILVFEKRKKSDKKLDKFKVVNFGVRNALQEMFALNTPITSESDQLNSDLHNLSDSVWEVPTAFTFDGETTYNNTFNIFISEEDIDRLQKQGEQAFIDYLQNRINKRLKFQFKNLKEALFNFNDNDFQDLCNAMPDETNQVMKMRNAGYEALKDIREAIDNYDADNKPKEEKIQSLIMLLHRLDKKFFQENEFIEWFSEFINDSDEIKLSRFLDLTKNNYKCSNSIFLQKAHEKRNKIYFKNRINHLIKTKINKMSYSFFQSNYNQKLLSQAKKDLTNATTETEVQKILKELHVKYVPTLFDSTKKVITDMFNSISHL